MARVLCTICIRQNKKTAIGSQETEPRPSNIIQIDQNLLETRLDRLVTQKASEVLNAMLDASGRRDRRGREIRAFRRTEGVPLAGTSTCSGLAARWRKRTDHRAMGGHDQKCATFRALLGLWAFFAYGPPHPALYEKVRESQQHERKGGGREAREKL